MSSFILSFLVHVSVWFVAAFCCSVRPIFAVGKQVVDLRALALGAARPFRGPASGLLQLGEGRGPRTVVGDAPGRRVVPRASRAAAGGGHEGHRACRIATRAPEVVSLDTWRRGLEEVTVGIMCDPKRLCEDARLLLAGQVLDESAECRSMMVTFRYEPIAHGGLVRFSAKVDGKEEEVSSKLPIVRVAPTDSEAILAEALRVSIANTEAALATFKPRGLSPRSMLARWKHPGPSRAALTRWFGTAKPSAVRALVEGVLRVLANTLLVRGPLCSEFGNNDEIWMSVIMYISRDAKENCTSSDLERFNCSTTNDGRYVLYYCPKWFLAGPLVGTQILLHEASHHPPVASNDHETCEDDPEGDCLKRLAKHDPQKALNNAENIAWYIMDVAKTS